ncbi:unnamed protein product [Linum tenue]|uniref:Nucleoside phosphorylase domain-containing protein n=1 Tax=Linum tenue TaxID=586396 RepID=A0AAV0PM40_9ROSI|nr:unnamed protein product [Linum tenue]
MNIRDVSVPAQIADTSLWNWQNPDANLDPEDIAHLEIGELQCASRRRSEPVGANRVQPGAALLVFLAAAQYSGDGALDKRYPQVASSRRRCCTGDGARAVRELNDVPRREAEGGNRAERLHLQHLRGQQSLQRLLFETFKVSSVDMESFVVVMTCLSNGQLVIVIRGVSDLAGKQSGHNPIRTFGSLPALNTANVVLKFISKLRGRSFVGSILGTPRQAISLISRISRSFQRRRRTNGWRSWLWRTRIHRRRSTRKRKMTRSLWWLLMVAAVVVRAATTTGRWWWRRELLFQFVIIIIFLIFLIFLFYFTLL